MTDKPKTIAEALAEVQRKINEQRMKNSEENWNAVHAIKEDDDYNAQKGRALNRKKEAEKEMAIQQRMKDSPEEAEKISKENPAMGAPTANIAKQISQTSPEESEKKREAASNVTTGINVATGVAGVAGLAKAGVGAAKAGMSAVSDLASSGKAALSSAGKTIEKNVAGGYKAGVSGSTVPRPQNINVSTSGTQGQSFAAKGGLADISSKVGQTAGQTVSAIKSNPVATTAGAAGLGAAVLGASSNSIPSSTSMAAPKPTSSTPSVSDALGSTSDARKSSFSGSLGPTYSASSTKSVPSSVSSAPKVLNPSTSAASPASTAVAPKSDDFIKAFSNDKTNTMPSSEEESGGKTKGKKNMKESTLISAFLKLQEMKSSNMFEAAKKLSPKQEKIAALGGDKKKLDAADFKALRSGKRPMEEADQSDTDTTTGPSGKKYVPDIYKSSKPQKSQSDTDTTTGPDGKRYVPDIYKNMKEETVFVTKRNDISGRKNIMEISKSQYDSRKHVLVSEGNIRLLKTHEKMDSEGQKKTAKVYKDHEWNEYRVKHFTNGKHHQDADYHTDDADDAHNTAKAFLKEEIILEKNWIAGAIKHPGAETRAAEKAGMSVQAYAKKHEHDSGTAGKRARLAMTLKKINKEEVEELDDVSEANTPEQLAAKEKSHKSDAFRYKINADNAKKRGDSDMEKYSSRKAEMHSKAASVAGKMMNKEEVDFSEEELAHIEAILKGEE